MNEPAPAVDGFSIQLGGAPRLSADEDRELRRLHLFHRFGAVAGRLAGRYEELRARDRRRTVREPVDDAVPGNRAR